MENDSNNVEDTPVLEGNGVLMLHHATGWLAETHLVHVAGVEKMLLICSGWILLANNCCALNCVDFCFQVSTHGKRCPEENNTVESRLQWTAR